MRPVDFAEIEGNKVGHAHDLSAATGGTGIIAPDGATVGKQIFHVRKTWFRTSTLS